MFKANQVIITYGLKPFDIISSAPEVWNLLKKLYIIFFIISNLIYSNIFYNKILLKIFKNKSDKINIKNNKTENINNIFNNIFFNNNISENEFKQSKNLELNIGLDEKINKNIIVPESGLYQNFLITGTIGSGKTSAAMYPFTRSINGI